MSQTLLDGTLETVEIQERLDFIRKLEDSQTPIILWDEHGLKHLVYVTKVSYARPYNPLSDQEEPEVTLVCVDASDGLWQQADKMGLGIELSVSTNLLSQTIFVYGPSAVNTSYYNRAQYM